MRKACGLLADSVTARLVKLVRSAAADASQNKVRPAELTCASILASLLATPPARLRVAMHATRLLGARVNGDRAFALYRQPKLGSGFISMIRENGTWKAGAISGSPFAPAPAARGSGHGAGAGSRSLPRSSHPPRLPRIASEGSPAREKR
jgi:hypothetical protein